MTAEEFIKDAQQNPKKGWTAKKMLIEFAKYHVKKALEAASEKVDIEYYDEKDLWVNKTILNAYPLENIK